jgi:hypothetical protein
MKKTILMMGCMIALNFSSIAQFSKADIKKSENDIRRLTSVWNRAIENKDSVTLNNLLSSGYLIYTMNNVEDPPTGGVYDRKSWINGALHGTTTDTSEVIGEQKITVYGLSAKSEQTMVWKARWGNEPKFRNIYSVTDIWIKKNHGWQVLSRNSYTVSAQVLKP